MVSGIEHIISSQSAPWCGWTMLGLLLCAILSEWMQPGVISQASASLAVRNDRLYKDAPVNFMGQLLITIFRIGMVAFALCLCWETQGRFPYRMFWMMSGIVLLVLMAKMLCNVLLDYTFMLSRRFGSPYEHYGNLFTLLALTMYPMVLILLRFSSVAATRWIMGCLAAVFILIWSYRIIRTYIASPIAVLYVLIYICTLEIVPFVGLTFLSAKMISML